MGQRARLQRYCKALEIKQAHLMRDTIDSFLPHDLVTEDFLRQTNALFLLKNGAPIRTLLPNMAVNLGYTVHDDWYIKYNGETLKLDPLPERSLICGIRIIEMLWKFHISRK
jgi:hypothetical protein